MESDSYLFSAENYQWRLDKIDVTRESRLVPKWSQLSFLNTRPDLYHDPSKRLRHKCLCLWSKASFTHIVMQEKVLVASPKVVKMEERSIRHGGVRQGCANLFITIFKIQ
jgi:hypothetical protein